MVHVTVPCLDVARGVRIEGTKYTRLHCDGEPDRQAASTNSQYNGHLASKSARCLVSIHTQTSVQPVSAVSLTASFGFPGQLSRYLLLQPLLNDRLNPVHMLAQSQRRRKLARFHEILQATLTHAKPCSDLFFVDKLNIRHF